MINFNAQDISVRLQLTAIYLGEFGHEIANDFFLGKKCANHKLRTLKLLVAYMEILKEYTALVDDVVTEEDNCITEEEMQDMFEHISDLIGVPFASPGTNYIE